MRRKDMPRFYFHLRAGEALPRKIEEGTWPTAAGAYGRALEVAKGLIRNGHEETRQWSLQVEDERGAERSFEVFFSDVAARFRYHRPCGDRCRGA
jgi:hypothetical protein